MKVIKVESYRDGGTICVETSEGNFYIDRRFWKPCTDEMLYNKFPGTEGAVALNCDVQEKVLSSLLLFEKEGRFSRFSCHSNAISSLQYMLQKFKI